LWNKQQKHGKAQKYITEELTAQSEKAIKREFS